MSLLRKRRKDPAVHASRERGAVFVEFALALPFLVLIAMGIVEYGMGWKVTNQVNGVARDAARAASSEPAAQYADRTILDIIGNQLQLSGGDTIEKVIVYQVTTTDGAPPSDCLTLSPSTATPVPGNRVGRSSTTGGSNCNVYGPKQVQWVAANPNNTSKIGPSVSQCSSSTFIDSYWCPITRVRTIAPNKAEFMGVYIKVSHKSITNVGFGDQTIERTAIFRLEPDYGG